jgi:phage protein U
VQKQYLWSATALQVSSILAFLAFAAPASAALVPLAVAPDRIQEMAPKTQSGAAVPVPAPKALEKDRYYIHATPVQGVRRAPADQPASSGETAATDGNALTADTASGSAITPLCTVLSINTTYTLSGTATGGSYCYGFQITQRAKTQVFLTGQNASTNFSLTLIRHNDDDTLTALGTSDQPGNANEVLTALTQPGLYYWLMTANASDGSAFNFGAIANTNADANEVNDAPDSATTVPDRTVMTGSMDSAQDIDYFKFVAQNGQDLLLQFTDSYGLNEWVFQYYNGSAWTSLSSNLPYTLAGLPAGYTLYVRVLPSASASVNPAHAYQLLIGTQVTSSDLVSVFSNENLVRITTVPYLTTQFHNQLTWSIRLMDSNGNPVQGAQANFRWRIEGLPMQTASAISNALGVAGNTITYTSCAGNHLIDQVAPNGQRWLTTFDAGEWDIKVTGADQNNVGVGGSNFPTVSLGHICRQTLE